MEGIAHKKGIVIQERQERVKQFELIKAKKVAKKAMKTIVKIKRAKDKQKRS